MSAVVFDLDGTLIDSAPDICAAANAMLKDEGMEPLDLATITSFIGHGLADLTRQVIEACGLDMARHKALSANVLEHYNAGNSKLTTLYPGVRQVLETLHRDGHALGLCTNKPIEPARDVLEHFGLNHMFSAVLGGDSQPERKPHPSPLLATFRALGDQGIYVGDSEVDAETAQRADIPFALFTEGYRKTPVSMLPHDWSFSGFTALPAIVASANSETAG